MDIEIVHEEQPMRKVPFVEGSSKAGLEVTVRFLKDGKEIGSTSTPKDKQGLMRNEAQPNDYRKY